MKTVSTEYIEDRGISIAVVNYQGRDFVGFSTLLEEDSDVASSYAGISFAERKAYIKAIKFKRSKVREELRTLEILYAQMKQLRNFEEEQHSRVCQHLRKQIKIKRDAYIELTYLIKDMQDNFVEVAEDRLEKARNMQKRKLAKEAMQAAFDAAMSSAE